MKPIRVPDGVQNRLAEKLLDRLREAAGVPDPIS